jgi:hypothetical protein
VIRLQKIKFPRRTIEIELSIDDLTAKTGSIPNRMTDPEAVQRAVAERMGAVFVNRIQNFSSAPKNAA